MSISSPYPFPTTPVGPAAQYQVWIPPQDRLHESDSERERSRFQSAAPKKLRSSSRHHHSNMASAHVASPPVPPKEHDLFGNRDPYNFIAGSSSVPSASMQSGQKLPAAHGSSRTTYLDAADARGQSSSRVLRGDRHGRTTAVDESSAEEGGRAIADNNRSRTISQSNLYPSGATPSYTSNRNYADNLTTGATERSAKYSLLSHRERDPSDRHHKSRDDRRKEERLKPEIQRDERRRMEKASIPRTKEEWDTTGRPPSRRDSERAPEYDSSDSALRVAGKVSNHRHRSLDQASGFTMPRLPGPTSSTMMYATSTVNGPEATMRRSTVPTPTAQRSIVSATPSQPSTTIRVSPTAYTSNNMPSVIPVLPSTSSHSSGGSRTLVPPTPVHKSLSVPSPLPSQHPLPNRPPSRSSPLTSSPLAINDSDSGKPSDHNTTSRAKDREQHRSHRNGVKIRHKDRSNNSPTSGNRPGHRERAPSLPVNSSAHLGLDSGSLKESHHRRVESHSATIRVSPGLAGVHNPGVVPETSRHDVRNVPTLFGDITDGLQKHEAYGYVKTVASSSTEAYVTPPQVPAKLEDAHVQFAVSSSGAPFLDNSTKYQQHTKVITSLPSQESSDRTPLQFNHGRPPAVYGVEGPVSTLAPGQSPQVFSGVIHTDPSGRFADSYNDAAFISAPAQPLIPSTNSSPSSIQYTPSLNYQAPALAPRSSNQKSSPAIPSPGLLSPAVGVQKTASASSTSSAQFTPSLTKHGYVPTSAPHLTSNYSQYNSMNLQVPQSDSQGLMQPIVVARSGSNTSHVSDQGHGKFVTQTASVPSSQSHGHRTHASMDSTMQFQPRDHTSHRQSYQQPLQTNSRHVPQGGPLGHSLNVPTHSSGVGGRLSPVSSSDPRLATTTGPYNVPSRPTADFTVPMFPNGTDAKFAGYPPDHVYPSRDDKKTIISDSPPERPSSRRDPVTTYVSPSYAYQQVNLPSHARPQQKASKLSKSRAGPKRTSSAPPESVPHRMELPKSSKGAPTAHRQNSEQITSATRTIIQAVPVVPSSAGIPSTRVFEDSRSSTPPGQPSRDSPPPLTPSSDPESFEEILLTPEALNPPLKAPKSRYLPFSLPQSSNEPKKKGGFLSLFRSVSRSAPQKQPFISRTLSREKPPKIDVATLPPQLVKDASVPPPKINKHRPPPITISGATGRPAPNTAPVRMFASHRHRTMSLASMEAVSGTADNTVVGSPTPSYRSPTPGAILPPSPRDPVIATENWLENELKQLKLAGRRRPPGVAFDGVEDDIPKDGAAYRSERRSSRLR